MMWETIYWVLLVIALVMLGRGLLWDRAGFRGRPKRRCRKCWYDLTGVDGEVSREPAVCPECGKVHKTTRSMRKTRRGKRWVVAALLVFLLGYSLRVTPAVKDRGLWAAVPDSVLIATIPFTPRSVKRTEGRWQSILFGDSSIHEQAMFELWRRARQLELDRLDYLLIYAFARLESTESLCGTDHDMQVEFQPRSAVYCYYLERGAERELYTEDQVKWIRRLISIELDMRETWPEGSRVFAGLSTRYAYRDRNYHGRFIEKIRIRLRSYGGHEYHFDQEGRVIAFPGRFPVQYIRADGMETIDSFVARVWSDDKVPVFVSKRDSTGSVNLLLTESSGHLGAPFNYETYLGEREIDYEIKRVADVSELVQVVDDDSVRNELERCLEAEGKHWYDSEGRRNIFFRLKLRDTPNLGKRRYTFGSPHIRSISRNERLAGGAWWALVPDDKKGWILEHGDEWVPMYGYLDEQPNEPTGDDALNLRMTSKPEFCLRDDAAGTVYSGRLKIHMTWEPAVVYNRN
ncbi:MAG: hypothetical protein JJ916_02065 [Phycisphaerales bacterium]|nr:hypothetical protein [Phycisphaerales bacterium]